jgi:hypothetical protein
MARFFNGELDPNVVIWVFELKFTIFDTFGTSLLNAETWSL